MRASSGLLGLVVAALSYGYQAVAALLSLQLSLLGQPTLDRWLLSGYALLGPLPYAVAVFFVFLLWRGARGAPGIALRAVVAAAAGAVLATLIGAVTTVQISGAWFTSVPRRYSLPWDGLAQLPSALVSGFLSNLPVLLVAAFVASWLLRSRTRAEFDRAEAIE